MWSFALPLLAALACTPPAADSDPPDRDSEADSEPPVVETGDSTAESDPPVTDADGDGYDAQAWGGTDCDDEDPAVNPGATETWYDGLDSDCSGGSDYDADGDGADAESYGGTDCDDADALVQEGCGEPSTILENYALASMAEAVEGIPWNLSGITWNPATGTFVAVQDNSNLLVELDPDMAVLRQIALTNYSCHDTEDLGYLGQDADGQSTYAIVTEEGVLYLGALPDDATTLDLSTWQAITYHADDMGNSGGEGVAYDAATGTFWVCKEQSDMEVLTFARPSTGENASVEDGSLTVSAAFDAEVQLGSLAEDLASCLFDERTGNLLILSERSDLLLEVTTGGSVLGTLDIGETGLSKPEGFTLGADGDLTLVGEPNEWARYSFTEPQS